MFPPAIADLIIKMKPPYNINAAAQVAALESLEDSDYLRNKVQRILKEKERPSRGRFEARIPAPAPVEGEFSCLQGDGSRCEGSMAGTQAPRHLHPLFRDPEAEGLRAHQRGQAADTDALLIALKEVAHGQKG